jgi:hypothetical protein
MNRWGSTSCVLYMTEWDMGIGQARWVNRTAKATLGFYKSECFFISVHPLPRFAFANLKTKENPWPLS